MQNVTLSNNNEQDFDEVCEAVASNLSKSSYAIVDNFLPADQAVKIRRFMNRIYSQGEFKRAGVGPTHNFQINNDIRKDFICWVDPPKTFPVTILLVERLKKLMKYINKSCFLGLKDLEMHYAIYPQGAYYKRHLDQFKGKGHRRISFACYLNDEWSIKDGGLLRMYHKNSDGIEIPLDIVPLPGRLVSFRSDTVEHEVLSCNRKRYSLTGWMLDQINELSFL